MRLLILIAYIYRDSIRQIIRTVKFKMYIERKAGALFSKMHIWLNEPLDEVSCLILNVVADII